MYIKIYTKSQLILLRRLIPLFKKKYRLPKEILVSIHRILESKTLGKNGFIAVLLKPVLNDTTEIQDILDCYPTKLHIGEEDLEDVSISNNRSWLTKGREWYIDKLELKEGDNRNYVYVIYSMTLKDLYGSEA